MNLRCCLLAAYSAMLVFISFAAAQDDPRRINQNISASATIAAPPHATQSASEVLADVGAGAPDVVYEKSELAGFDSQLLSTPNMIGGNFPATSHVTLFTADRRTLGPAGPAGGLRYATIGENNKALTMDRIYGTYQYFHNSSVSQVDDGPFKDHSISVYTVGAEKTFGSGAGSIEVRGSLLNDIDIAGPDTAIDNGVFSNVNVNVKLQLAERENGGIVGGLGVGLPTGSDMQAYFRGGSSLQFDNRALYLMPFLGATYAPGDVFFNTTFVQVAAPASADRLLFNGDFDGYLYPITTLHLSTSIGAWLVHPDERSLHRGAAWLTEFHYSTALQRPQFLSTLGNGLEPAYVYSAFQRFDTLNVTSGVHFQITDLTSFRIAGVFPIGQMSLSNPNFDRAFDGQVIATLNAEF